MRRSSPPTSSPPPVAVARITDVATGAVSDLFNVTYDLVLQMIVPYFAFGHESDEQLQVLADAAVSPRRRRLHR